jgi:hypothetical protein
MSISHWQRSFYDFGSWGYFTNNLKDKILHGFVATPPGIEICGEYDMLFVADIKYCKCDCRNINANLYLRRTTNKGNLVINSMLRSIGGMIFSGEVTGNGCDHQLRPFNNFFGFPSTSVVARSYEWKPSNASIIKTKLNHTIGRLYVVSDRKAFRLIDNEKGPMRDERIVYESQEHEVQEAEENCKSLRKRHLSFLCRDLGLPCQVASQITQYVIAPPFIFAEPGDVWIDIPKRTYVLARRRRS